MAGILYIVATPIGNLEDITLRAIKTLQSVDVILAEDTRVTRKLVDHITSLYPEGSSWYPQILSYHQHSSDSKKLEILKLIMDGKNVALVTDAGTPGISDPGNELIEFLLDNLNDIKIVPIPGVSAITTALSVSGFDVSKFIFLGFWPKKKAGKIIDIIKLTKLDVVGFYESPFRVLKTLGLLEKEFGTEVKIVIARELTKIHETIYRGTIESVKSQIENGKGDRIKGEIVVILKLA